MKTKKAKALTAAERWPRLWAEVSALEDARKAKAKEAKADDLIPLTFKWEITYGVPKPKPKAKKGRNPKARR